MTRTLESEARRLALWFPVALAAGVLLFLLPRQDPPEWLTWLAPLLVPLAAALRRRSLLLGWLVGLVAAAALGFAVTAWHVRSALPLPDLPRGAVVLTGTVSDLDILPAGARVTLSGARWDAAMPPLARTIRVRLQANDDVRPMPGEAVRVRALVRAPSPPAFPGAWDFQRAAFFEGSAGSGFALGRLERLGGIGVAAPLAGARAAMERRAGEAIGGDAGAIAAALLTGGKSGISPAGMQAMRDSGLAHLLSVSGLHIAIVMGLVFTLARGGLALWSGFALRWGTKAPATLLALVAGGTYTLLTGAQVPMLRSFAMAAVVTLGLLAGRRAFSPRVLAMAATFVLLLHPSAILGPSFQMSFAAVLALIAAAEALRGRGPQGRVPWWKRALWGFAGGLLTSLVAGAATTPFGLHHFGRLQLFGVAANAVAVPLTTFLVMPAGVLATLLMPLGLDAWPLRAMGLGVEAVLSVAREVASWPAASMMAVPIPGWGAAIVAFGLCWLCLWRTRWRWAGVPMLLLGLLSAALATPPDAVVAADGRLFLLRDGAAVFIERRTGASRFVRESWLRSLGEDAAPALPRIGETGRIACEPGHCLLRDAAGAPGVLLLRPPQPRRNERAPPMWASGQPCGAVAVILSPEPLRGSCDGTAVVDRFSVWRDGAHAVWLRPGGATVLSDRAGRGERPWVPPRPLPRSRTEEPPAETE